MHMAARFHQDAMSAFDGVVCLVRDDQWTLPTPCAEWDVRALVNHVVGEAAWTVPLLEGRTVADVGGDLDGDLLGATPVAAWSTARDAARAAVSRTPPEQTVHLSFGDVAAAEYLRQLTADYVVHSWDLATAIGASDRFEPSLVEAVLAWFEPIEPAYRAAGAIAERVPLPTEADPQMRLLAMFGRDAHTEATRAAVARFGAAFDRQDVAAVLATMTSEPVFESTAPPDGIRFEGRPAVRDAFGDVFAAAPGGVFETEEVFVCGDRAVVRWRYTWHDGQGPGGHVRGIDVFRVQDRLVAEKISYVKG